MLNLLQVSLFAREFEDVLFAALAPLARLLGYRASYPRYTNRPPSERVEPWQGRGVPG